MSKKSKGFSEIFIIVTLTMIVIAGIGYWAYKNGQIRLTSSPLQTSSSLTPNQVSNGNLANWKTYSNTKYNYQIQYPADLEEYSIFPNPSPEVISFRKITKDSTEISFRIIVEENSDKEKPSKHWYIERIKQIPAGINSSGYEFEQTTFLGLPTLKVNFNSASPELFVAKDDKMFILSLSIGGMYNDSDIQYAKTTFDQILSTFKFLDSLSISPTPPPNCYYDRICFDYEDSGGCTDRLICPTSTPASF